MNSEKEQSPSSSDHSYPPLLNMSHSNNSVKSRTTTGSLKRNEANGKEVIIGEQQQHHPYNEESIHKTILVGDSGVGKTSILVQFDQGKFQAGSFSATVGIGFTVSITILIYYGESFFCRDNFEAVLLYCCYCRIECVAGVE